MITTNVLNGSSIYRLMKRTIMSFIKVLSCGLMCSIALVSHAQEDFIYQDYVYVDNINTVEFKGVSGQTANFPVIQLDKGTLFFSFDDLAVDAKEYTYRVIHCDRNWQPSNLDRLQYIEGFDYEEIRNYEFSQNTYVDYVHYELQLPNRFYKWTISGNYLLVIYEGDEDNAVPVISRRFMVAEQVVNVGLEMKPPMRTDKRRSHHELDITINYAQFPINEPKREVKVHVLQNGNWHQGIFNLIPNYMSRNIMHFNYNDRITFPAIKEFREFDIRNLNFASQWVQAIDLHEEGSDVLLRLSEPRTYDNYHTRIDINGSFVISDDDDDIFSRNRSADIAADYCNVIFALKMQPLDQDQEVYPVGAFSGWMPLPWMKMEYNYQRNIYQVEGLFKQGYYNYLYAIVDGDDIDFVTLEGSSYETENDYNILVYLSEFSGRFDRLIAVKTINSNN